VSGDSLIDRVSELVIKEFVFSRTSVVSSILILSRST